MDDTEARQSGVRVAAGRGAQAARHWSRPGLASKSGHSKDHRAPRIEPIYINIMSKMNFITQLSMLNCNKMFLPAKSGKLKFGKTSRLMLMYLFKYHQMHLQFQIVGALLMTLNIISVNRHSRRYQDPVCMLAPCGDDLRIENIPII